MGSCLRSYLRASWRAVACFAALMLALHLVLVLSVPLRGAWAEIGYLDLILCALGFGCYLYGFAHYRSRYRRIAAALLAGEPLPPALSEAAEDVRVLSLCVRAEASRADAARSRLEAELREQRELLGSWAHEVKTPLAVCRLVLSREQAAPVRQPMEQQLSRIESQVSGVLHAERLRHLSQSLSMGRLDVPGLLRAAISRAAPLFQARALAVELEADPIDAMGDESCVGYILDQLLGNAAKYAPQGSTVRVSANRAGIAVANEGEIPAHQIGRLFDKGFFGDGGGSGGDARASGMGLYYARQTADALGGRLTVESTPGGGETTFTLALPAFQDYIRPASE